MDDYSGACLGKRSNATDRIAASNHPKPEKELRVDGSNCL